jgi:hypothetical protein
MKKTKNQLSGHSTLQETFLLSIFHLTLKIHFQRKTLFFVCLY